MPNEPVPEQFIPGGLTGLRGYQPKTAIGVDVQIQFPNPDTPIVELRTVAADQQIAIRIRRENGQVMVDLMADGTLVLGENYHPDTAARAFWAALARAFPDFFAVRTIE